MSNVANMPARGAAAETEENLTEFLSKPTEVTIPKHGGKITPQELKELFDVFEPDEASWTARALPTPAMLLQIATVSETGLIDEVGASLKADKKKLALRRQHVVAFVMDERCVAEIPAGGDTGILFYYWKGKVVKTGYLFQSNSTGGLGLAELDEDAKDVLPEHAGFKFAVPKKR